ncbi:MAG: hypothetical protein ACRETQ_13060 [Gammaproteobacteria bacterium]
MRRYLLLAVMLVAALGSAAVSAAAAASGSVDVRNVITVAQFSQTGLDKLPPAELQAFNSWLSQFLASPAAASAKGSQGALDVRNFMTVTQYDQSGLQNLSPVELGALNAWFSEYLRSGRAAAGAPVPAAAPAAAAVPVSKPAVSSSAGSFGMDTMTPEQDTAAPSRIESRIVGEFNGWNGNTVFKLENGQVWQQAATGFFTNIRLENPQVVIKKLVFGYLLTVPGQGETVFVRRIK